jgi:microsomal dipeptidase-like Zn-dependent dipeptidase
LVSIKEFCSKNLKAKKGNYIKSYLDNINYLEKIEMKDNISLSTDDMSYYITNKKYCKNMNIFKQKSIKKDIVKLLNNKNKNETEINNILNNNFIQKILQRL